MLLSSRTSPEENPKKTKRKQLKNTVKSRGQAQQTKAKKK